MIIWNQKGNLFVSYSRPELVIAVNVMTKFRFKVTLLLKHWNRLWGKSTLYKMSLKIRVVLVKNNIWRTYLFHLSTIFPRLTSLCRSGRRKIWVGTSKEEGKNKSGILWGRTSSPVEQKMDLFWLLLVE